MTIHWVYLIPALLLLWVPNLTPGNRFSKAIKSRSSYEPTVDGVLGYWHNWFDLVRAGLGAYLLCRLAIEITDPGSTWATGDGLIPKGVVLAIGVVIQTLQYRQRWVVASPHGYLSGLTVVLPGFEIGVFAVVAGWIVCGALRDLRFVSLAMAVALGAGGFAILGVDLIVALNVGLLLIPFAFSILLRKELFQFTGDTLHRRSAEHQV